MTIADMNGAMHTYEISPDGVYADIEVRREKGPDGDVRELVYLVLFNDRDIPLRVLMESLEDTIEPRGFAPILIYIRNPSSNSGFTALSHIFTSVGMISWDIDTFPPKVQCDPKYALD